MSRVGRNPISIPEGVQVTIDGAHVAVRGPKGELARTLPREIEIVKEEATIHVRRHSDDPRHRSLHGLTRTLVANMVEGVSKGFEKRLEIVGVGYRAVKAGQKLTLSLGYSHPIEIEPPEGVDIEVPNPTQVVVRGANREDVGQLAAKIRSARPPEPYQGKGVRYQGEIVRKKIGKTGKK